MDWIALEAMQKRKGLTNEDVAKKLGIDPATYYRKKRGETDFYRKEVQMLRKILDLSAKDADDIFFGD